MSNFDFEKPYKDRGAYKIPEGYFEGLNARIHERIIMEESKKSQGTQSKTWHISFTSKARYIVAACITTLFLISGSLVFINTSKSDSAIASNTSQQESAYSEQYVNDCMDYAMIDEGDIYAYLEDQ